MLFGESAPAFSTATTAIVANNDLKQALQERYSGDEYKRALELKLRQLKFKPGTRINSFVDEWKSVIRELYNIIDTTAVDLIAQKNVLAQLDPSIQEQAKILQLTGTCKLESILELVNTKAAGNMLQDPRPAPTYALKSYDYSRSYIEDSVVS